MGEFLNVLVQQFEIFWVLGLKPRSHIHAILLNSWFFICYLADSRLILHHQQGDRFTHLILIPAFYFFASEGQWKSRNNDFFKTWDRLHTDAQIEKLTYRKTDGHKKVKINTAVVNASPPDREHLYYPLDVEGVTLKGLLLPALI